MGITKLGGAIMSQDDIKKRIDELEREIACLPSGSITKKQIKDRYYYYHRISNNGKRTEKYISFELYPELKQDIEKRKSFEIEVRQLKKMLQPEEEKKGKTCKTRTSGKVSTSGRQGEFRTTVRLGERLKALASFSRILKKRECIENLREYVFGESTDKVFILYGLRRTGKTTMIRQIINELPDEELCKAAFIQITSRDTLADLDFDLRLLEASGYKYVFIDEVTLLEDFVEGAALFSDIYASSGMKIVLSGTDSLGFAFSKEEQLYDRCIMLHTTFVPYREFEEVLGIKGIEEYIRYGGTMSVSGVDYNNSIFANAESAEEYVDTSIAKNIQHSLRQYKNGGHFRQLLELHEQGELTNVINRVVENINHRFTKDVVERTFVSSDISITAMNLLRDKENQINIKDHMDIDFVTFWMMQVLDILNIEEQNINISNEHMIQIKEYLSLLDLISEIDVEYLPEVGKKGQMTVVTQPGLRFAQASAIVESLLLDMKFHELSAKERQRIIDRLTSEICGRMMEEIVLLETKIARPDKKVFKLQFAIGEYDMVVYDQKSLTCEIYEVKYSKEKVKNQCRHLMDDEKAKMTCHRYGDIVGRYVIFRGESGEADGIKYLNVEEYLRRLGGLG